VCFSEIKNVENSIPPQKKEEEQKPRGRRRGRGVKRGSKKKHTVITRTKRAHSPYKNSKSSQPNK
jgi:hypothetical protein